MNINVIYAIPPTSIKFTNWHDGFTEAMKLVSEHHAVKWVNVHPLAGKPNKEEILNCDILLVKSDWNWIPDGVVRDILAALPAGSKAPLTALAISGSNPPPEGELDRFDVLFYETTWYAPQVADHPNSFQAFGIDTDTMCSTPALERDIDYLMVGRPAGFKNVDKLLERSGRRVLVGEIANHDDTVAMLKADGIEVIDFIPYEDLSALYRRSKTVLVAAELQGGGERAVLEGRSCGCNVEIVSDNPKLNSVNDGPLLSHRDYAQQLLKGFAAAQENPMPSARKQAALQLAKTREEKRRRKATVKKIARLPYRVARKLYRTIKPAK
ncbi:hypothetical protein ACUH9Y_07150 [Dermabacteraceae bacterium P13115]